MAQDLPESAKTEVQRVRLDEVLVVRQSGVYDRPRKERSLKTSSLLERLSVSKFPLRCPRLYGLLFELRSFAHRIRSLWKRGHTRPIQIGLAFQLDAQQFLVRNKRTQARSTDIQKLHADSPWLSLEDCHLFLRGWDAGEEWHRSLGTATSGEYTQDQQPLSSNASVTDDATSSIVVQQSTKRDLSSNHHSCERV